MEESNIKDNYGIKLKCTFQTLSNIYKPKIFLKISIMGIRIKNDKLENQYKKQSF